MKNAISQITRPANLLVVAAVAFALFGFIGTIHAAEPAFDGGKSAWHDGFVRYDFSMDDETLAITPFTRPEKEDFAVGASAGMLLSLIWPCWPRGTTSWRLRSRGKAPTGKNGTTFIRP